MVVIDIGAHVGTFIDMYPHATVHAFEPNPVNYDFLIDKYKDNKNIHIVKAAVGNHDGKMKLFRYNDDEQNGLANTGQSSLLLDNKNINQEKFWEVNCVKLSTYLDMHNIGNVHILKIDTEGAEYEILEDLLRPSIVNRFGHILYEDHSFLFGKEYAAKARSVTIELYTKYANPHQINYGNRTTEWSSEVPYVNWKLEFPKT
jgi:FkbM family methyltransferase